MSTGDKIGEMNPAEVVIARFGGVRPAARALRRDPSGICRWRERGAVPSSAQKLVLKTAKAMRIRITAEELIYGAAR